MAMMTTLFCNHDNGLHILLNYLLALQCLIFLHDIGPFFLDMKVITCRRRCPRLNNKSL